MKVFDAYAHYYDLLYKDKSYADEANFVHRIIRKHRPNAEKLFELGCGTGSHAIHLARLGYRVCGIDQSAPMLAKATERIRGLPAQLAAKLKFTPGDIREIRLNERFDIILALFHVVSYLPENRDIERTFETVKRHLKPGGLFIFDCWYGPTVLTDRPVNRIKRISDDKVDVIRFAEPTMHPNHNLVDVNYQILLRVKQTNQLEEINETHRMRYLFKPEIEKFLGQSQMKLIDDFEWMTNRPAGFDTWGVCFVSRICE